MKRLLLMLLLITVFQGFSQTKGISYQAVILNPNPQELPGVSAQGNVLPNSVVTIQFTIVNATGTEEYQEKHSTLTDRYGMINLLIGTGSSTGSNDFADILWNGTTKKLKVGINFSGNGNNFVALNEQLLTYMPHPVSTATQSALDLKANIASPTFTGTPTLPTGTIGVTQTAGNNTTAIATTAFVLANAGGSVSGFTHYIGEAFNGGIIYYLYKGSDGLEHGLIVALTESTASWQTLGTLVNANRTEDGAYNTALMTDSPAATYIAGLGTGWYLPSIDELGLLYYNRYNAQKGLRAGGNTLLSNTTYYWSSTEYNATFASVFTFTQGSAYNDGKTYTGTVRGVRAF